MGARTTGEKQDPRKAQKGNWKNKPTISPEATEAGTVVLFIVGSPERQKPAHPRTSADAFPSRAPGRPDARTDKRLPKTGLQIPKGHQDLGVSFRLPIGVQLGLPSRPRPGKRLRTFEVHHEHLDPSIGRSRKSISLGAVVGASVPSSIFLVCHGRYPSGVHHSPLLAGPPDPLATSPTLFLVHQG
ncbi:hypothetical protein CRG98_018292 [Punica granatum]|uniref:Uncharacterized protein n=1 Tax=Punica granatum TaxID=22663 RepID=A0A2I0JYC0_PUNGR|nr:hypothetical protein CRG98_018292 [Punica granatum]